MGLVPSHMTEKIDIKTWLWLQWLIKITRKYNWWPILYSNCGLWLIISHEITFEKTNFVMISSETKTEIMCLSLSMRLVSRSGHWTLNCSDVYSEWDTYVSVQGYTHSSGASFTKPLERTSFIKGKAFLFLWEGHLKTKFHKVSFNSPYQRSSLKLKEGANVH